ncbi:MAG: hypothetical protein UX09_C0023G0009 [Candidatus Uhrbacteria bacterium GW2011_GWE2_45_35]|uniref:Uncharacterized protein n=2 Tax=Candidatus Uhriibacteriota TaxID=1752732 RepID=A0A0G1JG97_9BACT|nr:MAG: hypothetical protein UW63_C0023G0010 [Candidatus Uhrbacteria bacterium GW2011_GWF2_44_350]KKU07869.1 MAG: hypothetical protein UX09_C0023G0009 [Candidatus Uhrbacteria bacterium GW2011_GWE2_45_35]
MQALLRFWLDGRRFNLTPELRAELDQLRSMSWTDRGGWLVQNAERFGGFPECIGFLNWDRVTQRFYLQEANGQQFKFGPRGFVEPDFLLSATGFLVSEIEAAVYFFPTKQMVLGRDFKVSTRGGGLEPEEYSAVLDWEPCDNTHFGRCTLLVSGVPDLDELNAFVTRVRSGQSFPSTTWE